MHIGNRKVLATCVMLALGSGAAHATKSAVLCTPIGSGSDDGGNFTMLTPIGGLQGGTNDLVFTWDGTMFDSSTDYTGATSVSNATIASNQTFSAALWTAHHVQVFKPGTYTFDSASPGGNAEAGILTLTVGATQLGMHMLFDWGGAAPTNSCGVANCNIDVAVVLNKNATFGSGLGTFENPASCTTSSPNANCLWNTGPASGFPGATTANRPASNKTWMLVSVDGNGDGIPGIPMADGGPFGAFDANFSFNGTLLPADGVCGLASDTTIDSFSFTGVINAAFNTTYTSNTITISGLGVSPPGMGITVPISITGGSYSKNGGAYVTTAGTVVNTDTVTVQATSGSANGSTVTATLNIGGVIGSFVVRTPAAATGASGSNFTMIDPGGGVTGGTNDVAASWDNSCTTNVASNNFSHMTLSSTSPFSSYVWTAHHIRVFCPGTYTINTDNIECTTALLETTGCTPSATASKNYTFTVGAGQIGAHMLFDWNNARNIDVVEVWNQGAVFGPSPMHTGKGACNNPLTVWDLMSTDWDGDGKNGGAMIDGPFAGFSANFNIRTAGTPLSCSEYTPTINVQNPSAAGGCSISPTPTNLLARGDLWLLAGFLTWLGGIQLRLRRKTRS
jgi:hypothetical protein